MYIYGFLGQSLINFYSSGLEIVMSAVSTVALHELMLMISAVSRLAYARMLRHAAAAAHTNIMLVHRPKYTPGFPKPAIAWLM